MPTETMTPDVFADKVLEKVQQKLGEQLSTHDAALETRLNKLHDDKLAAFKTEIATKHTTTVVPGLEESPDFKKFSMAKFTLGMQKARTRGMVAMKEICPLELEMSEAAAKVDKDAAASADALGGFLVAPQIMTAMFVPLLREANVLRELGITFIDGLDGSPVEIPKHTGGTNYYHINHDRSSTPDDITKSDVTFGQVKMQPHTIASRTVLSNRLMNLSNPAAEPIIRNCMVDDIATGTEVMAFNGSGDQGKPIGLMQSEDLRTVSVGSVSAATSFDKFVDMIVELRLQKINIKDLRWLMDPLIWGALMKVKDPTDGSQPKARRLLTEAPPEYLIGFKYTNTGNVPANTLLLGAFRHLMFGTWGSLVVKVDDLSVLGRLQQQLLAYMDYDVQLSRGEAFCKGTSVTA